MLAKTAECTAVTAAQPS